MQHDTPIGIVFQPKLGYPVKPGRRLPNGAILLAETVIRTFDYRRDSIVLAVNPDSQQPFIVWHRRVTSDSPTATGKFQVVDTCGWGDYYDDLVEATLGYRNRIHRGRS
jgi:hypothetical protein